MANKKFVLGILVITLIFGMMVTGCTNPFEDLFGKDKNSGSDSGTDVNDNSGGDNSDGSNSGGNNTGGNNTGGNNGGNNNGGNNNGNDDDDNNNYPTTPSAPTGVTATTQSSSSIRVSWNSVSGATSYDVYYEIGSSTTKNFAGNVTGTSYTHTGLLSGTTYYYYIKAKNSNGSSDYSTYGRTTTNSVSVPGSSYSNAITVTSSGIHGSFPSGLNEVWYTFTRSGSGILGASDRYYSSTYTSDIVIDVYDSSLSLVSAQNGTPLSNIDVGGRGNTNLVDQVYFTNWSGKYYVKVRPYNNNSSNKGTFFLLAP